MTRRPIGLAIIVLGTAALVACAPVKKGPQLQSQPFACTGGPQTWVVPAGVTTATFDVYGAEGGTGGVPAATPEDPVFPGKGARTTAALPVTPGEAIQVNVGCKGGDGGVGNINAAGAGSFNGGGPGGAGTVATGGGGGGGGASDVRRGGTGLASRVLVAAGGGGSAGLCNVGCAPSPGDGGRGGHPTGGNGLPAGLGGGAGTQDAGGDPGPGGGATAGGPNLGGTGGTVAGGFSGGGGGGSSSGPADATFLTGVQAGNGAVVILWVA